MKLSVKAPVSVYVRDKGETLGRERVCERELEIQTVELERPETKR